jgi:hypothetical protein
MKDTPETVEQSAALTIRRSALWIGSISALARNFPLCRTRRCREISNAL